MSNMVINTNTAALNSHRALKQVGNNIQRASERLASGLRINRAADDAAGLAISEKMRSQIRGLDQASRNAQDGISLIQTAEGALQETENMLQRMRELVVQAANDTLETSDKQKISLELNQLTQEIDATANRTEFNKKKLIDGSWATTSLYFQVGANASQGLKVNIERMDATWLGVTKDQIGDIVAAGDRVGTTITDTKIFVGVDTLDFANTNTVKGAAGVYNFSNGAKMTIADNGVFTMQGFDTNGTFDPNDVFSFIPASFSTPDGLKFEYTPGTNNGPGVLKYSANKTPAEAGDTRPIQPASLTANPALTTISAGHQMTIQDVGIATTPNLPANMRYTFTGANISAKKNNDGSVAINNAQTYTGTELASAFGAEGGIITMDKYQIKVTGTGLIDTTVGAIKSPIPEGTPVRTNFISTAPPTNTPTNPNQMTYISNNIFKGSGGNTSILDFTDNDVLSNSVGTYSFSGGATMKINDDGTFTAAGFDNSNGNYNTGDGTMTAAVSFPLASTGLRLDYTPGAANGPGILAFTTNSTSNYVTAVNHTIVDPTGPAPEVNNLDGTKTQLIISDTSGTGTGTPAQMEYVFKFSTITAVDSASTPIGAATVAAFINSGGPQVSAPSIAQMLADNGGTGAGVITVDGIDITVLASGVVDTATPATRVAVPGTMQAAVTYDPAATNGATGNTGAGVQGTNTTGNTAPIINITEGKFVVNNDILKDENGNPMGSGEVISLLTTRIDQAIEMVSSQRAMLGAYQNRMEHTIKNLDTASENLSASESRIRDADMALEMMNLTKANVLSQAATSMLAQANMNPNNVLQLLR